MNRKEVKEFWGNRAKIAGTPIIESLVNFESNKDLAELKKNKEISCVFENMILNKDDIVVDLGAGFGQWSLRFSPKVKKVYAVEYTKEFIEIGQKQIFEQKVTNIEFVNCAAENFTLNFAVTNLFISGLLHYLDNEQYEQLITNAANYVGNGGKVFLREPISLLETEYELENKYSEEMKMNYSSLYRTAKQHIDAFSKKGFLLEKYGPFFEDDSPLNKHTETRLYYFLFCKKND